MVRILVHGGTFARRLIIAVRAKACKLLYSQLMEGAVGRVSVSRPICHQARGMLSMIMSRIGNGKVTSAWFMTHLVIPVSADGEIERNIAADVKARWPRLQTDFLDWYRSNVLKEGDIKISIIDDKNSNAGRPVWFVIRERCVQEPVFQWIERGLWNLSRSLPSDCACAIPIFGYAGLDEKILMSSVRKYFDTDDRLIQIWRTKR